MTQDDDRLLQALAELPPIAPDIDREARVRARCHSAVSVRASRRAQAGGELFGAKLVTVAAAVLCVYWATVLLEAARLGGSL